MAKKSAHPDKELFDYLSGALDEQAGSMVEQHLSACADCASVIDVIRALKQRAGTLLKDRASCSDESEVERSQVSNLSFEIFESHPDVSELAALFYAGSSRAMNPTVAAHVAMCRSCAAEIAEYARAERLASLGKPAEAVAGEVPRAAWEMIHEWEDSSFARPKPAAEMFGPELLEKLSRLFGEHDRLQRATRSASGRLYEGEIVPVIIVDRKGELRGVEMFEKLNAPRGVSLLRHAQKSEQFHNRPVHALLDFGEQERIIVSDFIRKDTVRFEQPAQTKSKLLRADYFIIEE
ncbi:MAG TPA: zf-HC2 domain-containing protein [Blastocatellia bacterium]|nr:zf-HC2 domain-containing protein [Blastocatellia bacterium]